MPGRRQPMGPPNILRAGYLISDLHDSHHLNSHILPRTEQVNLGMAARSTTNLAGRDLSSFQTASMAIV